MLRIPFTYKFDQVLWRTGGQDRFAAFIMKKDVHNQKADKCDYVFELNPPSATPSTGLGIP